MKHQFDEDDPVILNCYMKLIFTVINQAVDDYRMLKKHGAVSGTGVEGHKFGRRISKTSYRHYDGIVREHEAAELVQFFYSKAFSDLCVAIGFPACQIRRALGIKREAR